MSGPGARWLPWLLFAGVAAVYASALGNGFVYDDHEVVLVQEAPRSLADLARVFVEPHGLPLSKLPYYRAVPRASLLAQKALHGEDPALFHGMNALLAAAAAVGAFAVLAWRRFALPPVAAALGAAAFAVHPVASSVVHPVASGRETLLPALFALWAVAAHLRGGLAGRAASTLLLGLALLSKEQALALPAVLLLADALALTGDPPGRRVVAWLVRYAPVAAVVAGYLALRIAVLPSAGGEGGLLAAAAETLGREPLGPPLALLYALQVVFVPFVEVVYEPEVAAWWSPPRLVLALAACGLVVGLAARLPRRDRAPVAFWLLWIPVCMATTLNLVRLEVRFAERFVFLSSFGWVALVTTVAARYTSGARGGRGTRRWAACAAGAALVIFAAIGIGRGAAWRDDLAFARQWVRTSPSHANARFALGTALLDRGRVPDALGELREAVRLDPGHAPAHYNLAVALAWQRRHAEAIAALGRALEIDPGDADAHHALGLLLESEGQTERARSHFAQALRLRPGWSEPARALARLRESPPSP